MNRKGHPDIRHAIPMNAPTPPLKPRFAPRDPETGPQNHPIGQVRFTDGLAFASTRPATRPVDPSDDPDMVALAKRIRRKCEIMRLDAQRSSAVYHDLAEIITLAEIIAKRAGADDV